VKRPLIAVLIVACAALVTWAAISAIDGDADPPAALGHSGLTGLGSPPHLAVGTDPQPGELVLAEGRNWTFVITPRQELSLRQPQSASTVSDYTRPVTLNEASAFALPRGGGVVTLVGGPVDERAVEVVVEAAPGSATDARLLTAHDLKWFFAEIPGRAAISAITARAVDGEIVDEYTLPPMPPNGPPRARRGEPPHPPASAPRSSTDPPVGKSDPSACPTPLPLAEGAKVDARQAALADERSRPRARFRGRRIAPDPRVVRVVAGIRYQGQGGSPATFCGRVVARRTLVVAVLRRGYARAPIRSASLSQGIDFVARTPSGYRVWRAAH
jgi:hypothetical protein